MLGFLTIYQDLAAAQLNLYYERHIDFVKAQAKYDVAKLHPVWAFARVVRNAIVHDNTINIKDQNFEGVSWQGITYSPREHGRKVLGNDLELPDIICLMVEMDLALDSLDAEVRN